MDWRQCALILMHYIGYLVVLSVVTTQPCSHEDTLMRNQDCIDDVDCSKDYPYAIRECGDNTECYSTPFRSHCSCKNGFISTTGEISFDTRTDCVDINECDEAELCGPNASCNNTMGSYYCFCNRGFESSGEIYFPALTATFCQDINECDHDNDELCGPNESCHNTVGSYFCSCHQGFGSSGEIDSSDLTQTRCQEIPPGVPTRPREQEAPDKGNMTVPDNRNTPAPVDENIPEPNNGNAPTSDNGNIPAPVNGNTLEPANGNIPDPTNGGMPDPGRRNTPDPGNGNTPEPVSGNTFDPGNGNTSMPFNGNTPEPVNGNTLDPGNENTPAPFTENIPDPGNGNTFDPGNENTPSPFNGNTPEPVNGNTLGPDNENTPSPFKGNTSAPFTENIPDPGNENTPEPVNGKTLGSGNENTPTPFNENTEELFNGNTLDPVSAPSPNPPADSRSHDDSAVGRDPSLSAAPEQPASPAGIFCSLMTNASRLVDELCHKPANGLPIEDIILFTTQLLRDDSPLKNIGQEERLNSASKILQAVEKAAVAIALSSADQGLKDITSKEMDLQLRVIHVNSTLTDDKVRLEAKGNAVDISWRTVIGSKMTGSVAVAFIVYNNMDSILHGARCENKETNDKYKDIRLQSRVISATVGSSASYKFPVATSFILKHKEDLTAGGRLLCAYWSHTTSGSHWSARGCELVGSNDTHTTCQCDHLSSFAILMAFNEKLQDYSHDALSVVMFIGIPISLVCLAVAVGTFVFCSQARNAVTATHTQLCASLFLAELLFIMGIDRTGNQTMCGIIAGCLHYLFLTAFAWMSLESTQLYLMVKNLKNMRVSHSSNVGKYIYPLGYGSPALIVAISAAVYPNGYGSERNCWLQIENGFVWSFLGPVYLIILVNTFLFTMTLYILNEELANRDVKVSKIKDTRMLTFKAIAQVFILGCTWIFGLFHFQEETVVMAYLFTIVNSFQGTFIFIILCVLNPKVRAEYRKWITLICKSRKSLFESESTKVPLSVTSETV
ncbi:adhesion G protein-coupled receptor E1-like isoform X2 [Heterodontus francisci]|uniref:adhesion G protein-coupled receptor E1-like isoform X2 n=1 Tax=Heterodontus francisci TaxID=7792 RepID=UPI00355C156A